MEVGAYAYYDKATCGFDFEGAKADIKVSEILRPFKSFSVIAICDIAENSRGEHNPAARLRAQPDGGGPAARAVEGALGRRQGEEAPLLLRHGLPGECIQGDALPRVRGSVAVNLGSS